MGRHRKDEPKVRLKLSLDRDLLEQLEKDGVNKSRLFSVLVRRYFLRKKYKR